MTTPVMQRARERFWDNFTRTGEISIDHVTGLVSCTGDVETANYRMGTLPVVFDHVNGSFMCTSSDLISLKGSPRTVGKHFRCSANELRSLEGGPRTVGGSYFCQNNRLTSLAGVPESVSGTWFMTVNQDVPLLNLLHIREVDGFVLNSEDSRFSRLHDLEEILMRYRGTGYNGMAPCAARMAKAGYESNARMG